MYRGEVDEALDAFLHLWRDEAALLEEVAALHDAVANGPNLVEALDGSELRVEKALEHELHALLVGWQVGHDLLLLAVGELHLDEGVVDADALHATLGEHGLVGHVVEFILNAAAAAVQYKNIHVKLTVTD